IPMRGLRNRRISVIAAAHQNPFVPRAIVNLSPTGLTVVSLPIYDDHQPIAVLLLFATGNRTFPDMQLQTLSQALRVCARGLSDRDAVVAQARTTPRDVSSLAEAIAELAGETAGAAPAAGPRVEGAARAVTVEAPVDERVPQLEATLGQVREELERSALALR